MTGRAELLEEIDKLPPKFFDEVFDFISYLQQKVENQHDGDISDYQAMAADKEREQEAREWCNAYFGPEYTKWNGAAYGGLNLPRQ